MPVDNLLQRADFRRGVTQLVVPRKSRSAGRRSVGLRFFALRMGRFLLFFSFLVLLSRFFVGIARRKPQTDVTRRPANLLKVHGGKIERQTARRANNANFSSLTQENLDGVVSLSKQAGHPSHQ